MRSIRWLVPFVFALAGVARSRGIAVLISMHDIDLAKRFADRIVGMAGGRIVFDGPAGS